MQFAISQNLQTGSDPQLGAAIVWDNGGDGHVAIVDEVIDIDHIITVESGWNYTSTPIVRYVSRTRGVSWGYSGTCLGFIYLPYPIVGYSNIDYYMLFMDDD